MAEETPTTTATAPAPETPAAAPAPESAAAQLAAPDAATPPAGGTPPASAAAQLAAPDAATPPDATKPAAPEAPPAADLAKMSDEDYAKAVIPDPPEGEADRSLISAMSGELRAAGVQPAVMAKVAAVYRKAVAAEIARDDAARAERLKDMTARCLKEITPEERRDFAAAYAAHIAGDAALRHLVDHTELGSSPAFIRLIALAGATLRVERSPAAASAGSGQITDTDRAVFEATVPAHLR